MKKNTKVISLLLVLGLILSIFPLCANAENGYYNYDAEVLTKLGIIADYVDGEYHNEQNVTRAELAYSAAKLFNLPCNEQFEETYFDVNSEYWAFDEIAAVTRSGYMNGTSYGTFLPDENATLEQILKTLLYGMGYEKIIEYDGGYPAGIYKVSVTSGLMRGITLKEEFVSRNDFFKILTNALTAHCVEVNYGTVKKYTVSKTTTVMGAFLNMGKGRGVMTSNLYTSLHSPSPEKRGAYSFGDVKLLSDDVSYTDLLGKNVDYYYYIDGDDEGKLACVVANNSNKEISFTKKSFMEFYGDSIKYENEKGNINELELDPRYTIIYNNKAISMYSDDIFNIKNGEYRFVDNNKDGKYDVAFIYSEFYLVAGVIYNESGISIHDKINASKAVDIHESMDTLFKDVDGEISQLSEISSGDTLSVRVDKDKTLSEIIITKKSISGKLSSRSKYDVTIDDVEYELIDEVQDRIKSVPLNTRITVYLNHHGAIVDIYEEEDSKYEMGYIVATATGGMGDVKVKIFDASGEFLVFLVGDRVKIDGKSYKDFNNISNALASGQLVRYRLDSEGSISEIDTAEQNENEGKNTLHRTYTKDMSPLRRYTASGSVFGGKIPFNANTVFYIIPTADMDLDNYKVFDINEFDMNISTTCEAYSSNEYSSTNDAIVFYGDYNTFLTQNVNNSKFGVVTKISNVIDNEGNDIYAIEVLINGESIRLYCEEKQWVDGVSVGDYVQITYMSDKKIKFAPHVCYDIKNGVDVNPFYDTDVSNMLSRMSFSFGTLYSVDDNILRYVLSDSVNEDDLTYDDFCFTTTVASTVVYMIDKSARIVKPEKVGLSELKPYLQYGNNASKIFVHSSYGTAKSVYIIID